MKKEYDFSQGKRGAVIKQSGKTRITIFIDDDVISAFRAQAEKNGTPYQSEINAALKTTLKKHDKPVTLSAIRRVMREELKHV